MTPTSDIIKPQAHFSSLRAPLKSYMCTSPPNILPGAGGGLGGTRGAPSLYLDLGEPS